MVLVRISALVAIVSSSIAFALCVLLVTAGESTSNAGTDFWLAVSARFRGGVTC